MEEEGEGGGQREDGEGRSSRKEGRGRGRSEGGARRARQEDLPSVSLKRGTNLRSWKNLSIQADYSLGRWVGQASRPREQSLSVLFIFRLSSSFMFSFVEQITPARQRGFLSLASRYGVRALSLSSSLPDGGDLGLLPSAVP